MILSKLAHSVLLILADYQCHKGQTLATQFNVTRQAIWKAINELQRLTVPIISLGHQGYQLQEGWTLLENDKIQSHLTKQAKIDCQNITIHLTTNSTNDDAKNSVLNSKMTVVVSEHQKQGRGRSNKTWISPFAANLYFSAKCIFTPASLQHLMALSPNIGILIADILRNLEVNEAKVKWPNDIWVNQQKLAGILIEIEKEAEGLFYVTIGIGINVLDLNLHEVSQGNSSLSATQYTSCEKILGKIIDRNLLVALIINALSQLMAQFEDNSAPDLSLIWANYSALFQQDIRLFSTTQEIIGKEVGIQKDGALLIQTDNKITPHYMGELSLRPL